MSSLLQAWPVLVFIILTACIAGIIMWFVVCQHTTGCPQKNSTLFDFMQRKSYYKSYRNEIRALHSEDSRFILFTFVT